jgi:hypothetical protein
MTIIKEFLNSWDSIFQVKEQVSNMCIRWIQSLLTCFKYNQNIYLHFCLASHNGWKDNHSENVWGSNLCQTCQWSMKKKPCPSEIVCVLHLCWPITNSGICHFVKYQSTLRNPPEEWKPNHDLSFLLIGTWNSKCNLDWVHSVALHILVTITSGSITVMHWQPWCNMVWILQHIKKKQWKKYVYISMLTQKHCFC